MFINDILLLQPFKVAIYEEKNSTGWNTEFEGVDDHNHGKIDLLFGIRGYWVNMLEESIKVSLVGVEPVHIALIEQICNCIIVIN